MVGQGRLAGAAGAAGRFFGRHGRKIGKGAGIAGWGLLLTQMLANPFRTRANALSMEDDFRRTQSLAIASRMMEERRRRERELTAGNVTRLMTMNPVLAQELLAGQSLPVGATVVGGKPRVDVLEEVARQMGEGNYGVAGMIGGSFQ
jgi:hypothetical protein